MTIELDIISTATGKAYLHETLMTGTINDSQFRISKIVNGNFLLIQIDKKKYAIAFQQIIEKIIGGHDEQPD